MVKGIVVELRELIVRKYSGDGGDDLTNTMMYITFITDLNFFFYLQQANLTHPKFPNA